MFLQPHLMKEWKKNLKRHKKKLDQFNKTFEKNIKEWLTR